MQNAAFIAALPHLLHFLEGHLSSLHSRLTQESQKTRQINVSST